VASYSVDKRAVARAEELIRGRQRAPKRLGRRADVSEGENAFLESHSWEEYAEWHLG
jgi:hypothetical protein